MKRIAKKATIVARKKAMKNGERMTKCGIASAHLTSQSHRLIGVSSFPSTRTG